MTRPLPLALLLLLTACPGGPGGDPPEPLDLAPLQGHPGTTDTLLQVGDYQQPCNAEAGGIAPCLTIRFEGDDEWTEFDGFIGGYDAEWGERVLLDVTDDGAGGWTLISVLERADWAGQPFAMRMAQEYLQGGLRFVGGREFECTTWDLCEPLEEALATGTRFEVWMLHPEVEGEPLQLTAVAQ